MKKRNLLLASLCNRFREEILQKIENMIVHAITDMCPTGITVLNSTC